MPEIQGVSRSSARIAATARSTLTSEAKTAQVPISGAFYFDTAVCTSGLLGETMRWYAPRAAGRGIVAEFAHDTAPTPSKVSMASRVAVVPATALAPSRGNSDGGRVDVDGLPSEYLFQRGHRLRVDIASSSFPAVRRQLQYRRTVAGRRESPLIAIEQRVPRSRASITARPSRHPRSA